MQNFIQGSYSFEDFTFHNFPWSFPDTLNDFPRPTIKFYDFPALENEILEFHDFPGFQWPIKYPVSALCKKLPNMLSPFHTWLTFVAWWSSYGMTSSTYAANVKRKIAIKASSLKKQTRWSLATKISLCIAGSYIPRINTCTKGQYYRRYQFNSQSVSQSFI